VGNVHSELFEVKNLGFEKDDSIYKDFHFCKLSFVLTSLHELVLVENLAHIL